MNDGRAMRAGSCSSGWSRSARAREDTRRRVRRSELATLADAQTMDAVIETFGRHRLLSFDRDPDTREPTVEIAHEALLARVGTPAQRGSTTRGRRFASARGSLGDARMVQAERSSDYLMSGIRLAQAEEVRRERHGSPH